MISLTLSSSPIYFNVICPIKPSIHFCRSPDCSIPRILRSLAKQVFFAVKLRVLSQPAGSPSGVLEIIICDSNNMENSTMEVPLSKAYRYKIVFN